MWYQQEHDACGIGSIVNIDGRKDHKVLDDALHIVEKLEHRAGKDATGEVGDGVGILTQISHKFFVKAAAEAGIDKAAGLEEGDYGVGMFFLPQNTLRRTLARRMFEVITQKEGMEVLGWREVPVHEEILGKAAVDCMPCICQCFVARPDGVQKGIDFDRRLYVVRREFEQSSEDTYICSLSSRTIVYKGMFLVGQLRRFYDDLQDPEYEAAIAIVHSRFSTNTTPSWHRAHPYRMIAHNGEINTIRGNIDRMLAREETMTSPVMQDDLDKIFPVVDRSGSDSAMLDNTLEFLYMNGMPLALAMMVIIPEPWKHNTFMSGDKKDFYHYYATMMEPWDGPAAILFTDGEMLGATLDRNGLRPSRYYITDDDRLILASEVGVLDIDPARIVKKARLEPGRILLVDTKQKRIISDEECKTYYAGRSPYGEWLDRNLLHLKSLAIPNRKIPVHSQQVRDRLYKVFGYTYEDVKDQILPMAENGVEPTLSMGHDAPLAVLSKAHQLLFNYFKQLFAQVTNPPIDSLREKIVTDTTVYIGSDGDLLGEKSGNCTVLEVDNPILTGVDLLKIRSLNQPGFRAQTISLLFYKNTSLERALDQLNIAVDRAAAAGFNILILSDRGVDENHVPIPSLLAVSSVEQHLVQTKKRTAVSLILESGEPRDVHQIATLLGFGARAVNPYLAHECIGELIELGILDKDYHTAVEDYNKALLSGVVKISAKMGISTLQSYQSARIFEAIGLGKEVIDRYFAGTVSRVGGIGIKEIEEGVAFRHDHAFDPLGLGVDETLDSVGFHYLRSGQDKEDHMYSPETIVTLQRAVREGSYERFRAYTDLVDDAGRPHTLRGLLEFVPAGEAVPLEEVEPASEIVKHFKTGAMSYGSLSAEAHETLAVAMNSIGARSNTGEGGELRERFGTEKNSKIKQVASGRFGVTSEYLCSAEEIQIKMAQGAKPGEGGHLPGKKVYPWVAETRFSTPGVALISPPPHHDIYSIEDLAQLIYDLKSANRAARINVKLVSEAGVGTIASGVAKAGAQVILISGYDGGTGAAPGSSIHNAGLPWELGLTEAHRCLTENGLRDKVVLETDGKLMSGRDVAIAALLGAEEFGFATAPLVCLGCMMMRVCSKDTCPVGIATQNKTLRGCFKGKPEYVTRFMLYIAEQVREIMAKLGFRSMAEMTGRSDCLRVRKELITDRAFKVDMRQILGESPMPVLSEADRESGNYGLYAPKNLYDFELEKTPDLAHLLPAFEEGLAELSGGKAALRGEKATSGVACSSSTPEVGETSGKLGAAGAGHYETTLKVSSTDRAFGTIFGSEITKRFGGSLAEDTFVVRAQGGGGQSFGAFLPAGVTIRLSGDANDGFGKGLSGGKLVLVPDPKSRFDASQNIIVGNVALYGATGGKAFINGIAGERFCVRNSGAIAVAEGCGDHGLEYMTGGRAVILGGTGKNFAAGMSGGIAYVLDRDHSLYRRINKDMVALQELTEKYDIAELCDILTEYVAETGSELGRKILADYEEYIPFFKKVVPLDYQRMLTAIGRFEEQGIPHDKAVLEAFREVTNS
ncbi:MAG: glutamate synthase large subunit [Lachnospiraceae bacterium]|nr:glutamate synthase large subunit [Lachnospiraceae bacterium]